ncbi:shikimate dehydrogenase [Caulobacter segnis]|jgi:shikimate dehydrogenase|uniref:shikimate dehydrogenase n=1 Tax=Caulobacter segnis TaxID=88688 RepID=UPI001CBF9AD0|nr:shikimate dehydrogenase [Caulobacter segnis]UAL09519.1 shikimate dehydrogenase [Caulobacter segnis]
MTQFRAGLIGSGIQASLTPAMHEAEGAAQGHAYRYDLIDTDRRPEPLADLLDWAQGEGFSGLNITHPYKQAVMPLLDRLDPDAQALGAVNTVVLRDGLRVGHNTDWSGFAEGLRRTLPDAPLGAVVQLGAGGAGSAVAYALLKRGAARLAIFDNDAAKAADLVARMAALFPAAEVVVGHDLATAVANADGLVNCTPVGMAKYPGAPLPLEYLRPSLWVADVVYFPLETALLAAARTRGCAVVDGGGMAVFQAVEAFRLITGLTPDPERMIASFKRLLTA